MKDPAEDTQMTLELVLALAMQGAQPAPEPAPGTRYDPKVPTLQQVVGHDVQRSGSGASLGLAPMADS